MIRAYFYKLIRSAFLYIGIIGVIGVCSLRLIPSAFKGIDVMAELEIVRGLDGYRKLFVIMGALPFAANFSDEWNSMVTTNCVTRKSAKKYAAANVAVCYISSFVTVFTGMMIFAGIYSTFYPLYADFANGPLKPYDIFVENGLPVLDLAARTFVFAANCAMWAVMGLMLSAFFPSKYIAICAPIIFCYAIERMTANFSIEFDLQSISLSYPQWDALPAFLYSNAVFVGISVICGIVFLKTVERRVQNELN